MAKNTKKLGYVEPAEYFPKEIRKKYKLGEFAEDVQKKDAPAKKKVKRK